VKSHLIDGYCSGHVSAARMHQIIDSITDMTSTEQFIAFTRYGNVFAREDSNASWIMRE
jgi:hypothetical protein